MIENEVLARIREDQRRSWEAGAPRTVEAYLTQHPELADDADALLDLIYSEVLLREEFGERAPAAEYLARFPTLSAALARQFELHDLLRSGSSASEDTPLEPIRSSAATVPDANPLPGFRLGRLLGQGSWGVVYEATQVALNRRVAVKVSRDAGATVLREARAAGRLNSPHIVQVHDALEVGGRAYLIMELVDGHPLSARAPARLPVREAARVVLGAARGVGVAHRAGIVHRDLKPANVLIAADGTPKVTDFGLARWTDAPSSFAPRDALVGTAGYMAPEQASGAGAGPPADVWALGVILHELVTGELPFRGEGLVDTVLKAASDPTPAVPALDPGLDAIRRTCLEKTPADRYPTANELADDLARWLRGERPVARRAGLLRRIVGGVTRRPVVATGLLAGVLVAAVGGSALAYRWSTDPAQRTARALRRGEPVTLVGASGAPAWHRWQLAASELAELDDGSGCAWFRAPQLSLLELCADPQCDRYRLTAELRHLDSPNRDGSVGVFVGSEAVALSNGGRGHRWLGTEYSDLPDRGLARRPRERRVECLDCLAFAHPDGTADVSRPGGSWFYPAPNTAVRLPPWRRFTLTVGPDSVRVEWCDPDSDFWPPQDATQAVAGGAARAAIWPLPALPAFRTSERQTALHLYDLRKRWPGVDLPAPVWSPRRPCGVYARRASVAVRNVVLEPLSE